MALSNAERQARYREKHLKDIDADKTRLKLVLDIHTKKRLERVARHRGLSVTALIAGWAEKAEHTILAKLTPNQEKQYFDGK